VIHVFGISDRSTCLRTRNWRMSASDPKRTRLGRTGYTLPPAWRGGSILQSFGTV